MIYCFSSLYSPLDSGPGTPAQLLAGKAKEVDALAMGFLDTSNNISGEDGVEPLQGRVGEEVEEMMEECLSMSKMKEAAVAQGSLSAEEPERHTEVKISEGSRGTIEAKEPEGSSGDKDTSSRAGKGPSAGMRGEWEVMAMFSLWPWRRALHGFYC